MNRPYTMVFALVLAGVMAISSCASHGPLLLVASQDIPAAEGTVKVTQTDDGNSQIQLEVKHLALPERVNPGATVYVVWVSGPAFGDEQHNMGALKVDDNLNGSLTTLTPLKVFNLSVTAEPSQASTAPTGRVLLSTSYPKR